jgi:hypothetical protein
MVQKKVIKGGRRWKLPRFMQSVRLAAKKAGKIVNVELVKKAHEDEWTVAYTASQLEVKMTAADKKALGQEPVVKLAAPKKKAAKKQPALPKPEAATEEA